MTAFAARAGCAVVRMSSLPILTYCGEAGRLSATHGSGRPAAMSSAYHASCAGAPEASAMLARLSDKEREEVLSWETPTTVIYADGVELDYASAEKEAALALDDLGFACPPTDDAFLLGHMDFGWVRNIDGLKVAFVADIKKQVWTTADGPESLQLHGYGYAYAQLHECDAYVTGIWLATEGEWQWSDAMVLMGSPRAEKIWGRLFAAATNDGGYSTGQHCRSCWSRLHCTEHMLPAIEPETWLAPVMKGGDIQKIDAAFVLKLFALEEIVEQAKEMASEAAKRGDIKVIDPATGKMWGPIMMPGRKSLNVSRLREKLGPRADEFFKKGAGYTQMRWVKAR